MMYGYGNTVGGGGFGMLLMLVFGALLIAGIVLVVVWLVRGPSGTGHPAGTMPPPSAPGHDEAVAIARRRFASGEITKEQYDELMRCLAG
jgi:putative membrane protein